jgi:gingipain R
VGRFSGTTTDVTTMVTRTLEYEKTPAAGNWMEKAIGVASAEGPGDDNEYDDVHMRNIRTKLMGFGYTTVHEFYDGSQGGSDASGNPTPSIVQTAVNSGAGLFNYTGHGDQNTCVTSNYSSTEIAAATNTGFYPLVVSVACNNGTFTSGTCISESWTRAKKNAGPTGALAAAGSSILMAWAPPMETQDEMAEIIAQTVPANNKNKIGGIFYNGQISMLSEYGSQGNEIMQTWIFFGDPSAQFRNKQTLPITVSHTANVPQSATSVTVNCNVAGALVAISQGDVLLGFGAAAGGSAVITIPTLANDNPLLVTATKQNYATYQGNIQVGNGALSLNENQLEFVVYPNPASDQFTVKGANLLNTEISIVSFTGQVVKTIVATENNAVQIDVNDLANGSYLLQMKSNEGVTIKKIQIIK